MFNVTPSSSAMHSLRQPSANGVTSTVFSSPHEHRISSTTGSVPDPLTLRLLPTGRAAPSRPFLLSTSQTLTRLCSQATHLPGHRQAEADTSNPGCQMASCLGKPANARTAPRCRLGSSPKAENASEDSIRGPAWPQRKNLGTSPAFAIGPTAVEEKPKADCCTRKKSNAPRPLSGPGFC